MAIIPDNADLILTIVGQHRSEALAVRNLRQLEKQYPPPDLFVRIAWRRNARGQFSARGQFFNFEVWRIEEEEEEVEWTGAFDSP